MMKTCSLVTPLILTLLTAANTFATGKTVYVPIPVADKIQSIQTTQSDIGTPDLIFDQTPKTLLRTPSINPAWVEVVFSEPITCEAMHILVWAKSDVTVAAADNASDLDNKTGSYRVIIPTRENNKRGWAKVVFDEAVTAKAFRLDTLRKEGDDYVHIAEWQFCRPGTVDALELKRVIDRRKAHEDAGREDVKGPIVVPVDTVVWLKPVAMAGEVPIDVQDEIEWATPGDGIEPFGNEKGMFLVTNAGKHTLWGRFESFEKSFTIQGTPREIDNRKSDVEVLFIERLPRIDYPPGNNEDPHAGLPAAGDTVTWRAHVCNWGKQPVQVDFEWKLDGKVVKRGSTDVPTFVPDDDVAFVELPWEWEFDRHDLTLHIEPRGAADDLIAANNTLTIQTDAITVGLWCERSLWDFHHENQHRLPTDDANSFAGWGQRMMRIWNKMYADAVFPEFPDGIQERVRLDLVKIVPDFALPLNGGIPSNNPDLNDKTVDMTWGCEALSFTPRHEGDERYWWSPEWAIKSLNEGLVEQEKDNPPFWCGLGYIHEMAHARYLVDAYGFNVHTGTGDDVDKRLLRVTVDGEPILGTFMPLSNDIQHWRKYVGQMGGNYWAWSKFDAMCWDRVRGWRARGGNCNSPPTIGEFLQDIPTRCIYEYRFDDGTPVAKADVYVYQARGTGKDWYSKLYLDKPDVVSRTDAKGRVTFDRTLWAANGKIRHTFGHSNGKVLIRLTCDGQHYILFEEVTDANLAYNFGHTDEFVFPRIIQRRSGPPNPEDWDVNKNWAPEDFVYERVTK